MFRNPLQNRGLGAFLWHLPKLVCRLGLVEAIQLTHKHHDHTVADQQLRHLDRNIGHYSIHHGSHLDAGLRSSLHLDGTDYLHRRCNSHFSWASQQPMLSLPSEILTIHRNSLHRRVDCVHNRDAGRNRPGHLDSTSRCAADGRSRRHNDLLEDILT